MSDYPFFIPEVVLFTNSSLFWFKVANEHREFRNYLLPSDFIFLCMHHKYRKKQYDTSLSQTYDVLIHVA